jgi:hypothetical protein
MTRPGEPWNRRKDVMAFSIEIVKGDLLTNSTHFPEELKVLR